VRHACKLLPPWLIKGGAAPQPRGEGTTDSDHSHALRLLHDIGTCLNQHLWDLEASPSLPPCLWPPLYEHHGASNTVPRAHYCWTYGPGRNQDKPSVLSCLAPGIKRQISALITS
jgi:hypothetical protein